MRDEALLERYMEQGYEWEAWTNNLKQKIQASEIYPLRIEPTGRNSGLSLESRCHADDLMTGLQNLIGQHLLGKEHHGLLTGSALTDLNIILLTGRDHINSTFALRKLS